MYFGESVNSENRFYLEFLDNLRGLDHREFIQSWKHKIDIVNFVKEYYSRYNISSELISKYFEVNNITQYNTEYGFELNIYCDWNRKIFDEFRKQNIFFPNHNFSFKIDYDKYEINNRTKYRWSNNDFS